MKADPVVVILLVEDDRLINLMASAELQREGLEVISAFDADEAIDILNRRDDIRLVFTDIDMPGSMDGLRLAAAVRDRWPPVEIIVTSGMHSVNPDQLPERAVFIPKPYNTDQVIETIRDFG